MILVKTAEVMVESETGPVDFLDRTKKSRDWRFRTWKKLNRSQPTIYRKTIYWLGTVDLGRLHKDFVEPIYFANENFEFVEDCYISRLVNGTPDSKPDVIYQYNLGEMQSYLTQVRRKYRYLHTLLEEKVREDGCHQVYLLSHPKNKPTFYGILSKDYWFYMPYKEVAWVSKIDRISLDSNFERICLLGEMSYCWVEG